MMLSDSLKTEAYYGILGILCLLHDYIKKLLISNGKSSLRCMHVYMSLVQ